MLTIPSFINQMDNLLQILFTFLLFLFVLIKLLNKLKVNHSAENLPPGPMKLPIIGNMHQVVSLLPHRVLRDLANQYGPLMHLQLGGVSTVVVSSSEVAKEVMKTHDLNFAYRPALLSPKIMSYNCTDIAFAPYGNYWRQMRKICTIEVLSAKRVHSFRSMRETEVSNFIKTIYSNVGLPINLSEKISSLLYGITSSAAFGEKNKDQEAYILIVKEASKLASGFCVADLYPSVKLFELISGVKSKATKLLGQTDKILQTILNDHRARRLEKSSDDGEAKEDLVDVFLKLQEQSDLEFPLTDNNIKAVIMDIFSAGSETSSTTIEWGMSEMLKNPRVMKKAQAEVRRVYEGKGNVDESCVHELKFLKAIIKETLRLHPAAPLLLPRESVESCEINGYEIAAKTRVLINAWAIGRDPKLWSEAERFNPERFVDSPIDYKGTDFEYIPFGAGRRICPGILFAIPNIELPLAQMLYHFDWKLDDGKKEEDLDMTEAFGLDVRRKSQLILVPTPHHPIVS